MVEAWRVDYMMIEVLTNEIAHHGHTPVYEAVLSVVRRRRIAARVHVYRGIAGASPDTGVLSVTRLLMTHHFKGVPVVDDPERVVGIVTEEDLIVRAGLPIRPGLQVSLVQEDQLDDEELKHLRPLTVQQVMTTPVTTVQARAPVAQAVGRMVANRHRTLPVLDGERLVGMISRLDVIMAAGQWNRGLQGWAQTGMVLHSPRIVGDALSHHGRCVKADDTLLEVGSTILEGGIRRVAVVDADTHLLGIVAESDLLRALAPEQEGLWTYLVRRLSRSQVRERYPSLPHRLRTQAAADIMTTEVVVGRESEPLPDAIRRMADHGLKELPVVDNDGRFLGFLSRRDFLKAIAREASAPGTVDA